MDNDQHVRELRNELEASRWDMFCGIEDLGRQFNVPSRVRRSIREEPWKWVAGVALVGALAGRLAPMIVRRSSKGVVSRFAGSFARQAVAAALPFVATLATDALERRRRVPPAHFP